jgi:Tfp pilus assembly protein PilN
MLEKYYRINQAAGVSIILQSADTAEINACSIDVNNNQLNFEKKETDIKDLESLGRLFPAKTIIALNLTGKGILQKQIEKTEEISQNNFTKVLPNGKIEDFYVENFISGDKSFISIIRKSEADKWISRLQAIGFVPLMLSLGPFPVQNIISQLNIYGGEIIFSGHKISRNEKLEWINYQNDEIAVAPFPLKVESEAISEKLILAYAAVFQLVMVGKVNLVDADVPELSLNFQKLLQDKKLKVQGALILAVFFVLLLVNFFVFSWLNSSNAKLTEQVSRTAQNTDDVQKINEQVQQKEALLKTLGYEGAINKSILVDQLASLLPEDITWKEATLDPIDLNTSRSQKTIIFFNKRIKITGTSDRIIPVNEWIARIKTRPWVKNVQLESYYINSELNTGQFIILIDY